MVQWLTKHKLLFGIFVACFTIIFCLLTGELFVRKVMPQNTYNVARSIGLSIYEPSENIPYTLQKNVKNYHNIAFTREFDSIVNTNSHRTRGPEFSVDKPADTYRILFLGDSMTFGWGVNDNETFSFLTGEKLNSWAKENNINKKIEVINAGFADGKTLDTYYVYLKNTGLNFNPDLIVLDFFPFNDISDLLESNWDKTDHEGLPEKISSNIQHIVNGRIESIRSPHWMYQIPVLRNSHLAILAFSEMEQKTPGLVKIIKKLMGQKDELSFFNDDQPQRCIHSLEDKDCPQNLKDAYVKAKKLEKAIAKLANENQKDFVTTILIDPIQADTLTLFPNMLTKDQPQKDIREFLDSIGVANLDFAPALTGPDNKSYFYPKDGHLTKEGDIKVADYLSKYLEDNLLKDKFQK